MGTSSSSKGPGGGVPMVPPWVPDANAPVAGGAPGAPAAPAADAQPDQGPAATPTPGPSAPSVAPVPAPAAAASTVTLSPGARFGPARRSLGKFAQSGDAGAMRRGLGGYVHKGYGGAGTAAKRFGGSARTAGTLYGALNPATRSQVSLSGGQLDPVVLQGRSADAVMNAVVDAVRPVDGTQDAEASRYAIKEALSELLTQFPDAE